MLELLQRITAEGGGGGVDNFVLEIWRYFSCYKTRWATNERFKRV